MLLIPITDSTFCYCERDKRGNDLAFFCIDREGKKDFDHCVRIFIMVEVENRKRSGKTGGCKMYGK